MDSCNHSQLDAIADIIITNLNFNCTSGTLLHNYTDVCTTYIDSTFVMSSCM